MSVPPETAAIIQRKKLLYCRYADTNQLEKFDEVMLPDCKSAYYNADGTIYNKLGKDHVFPTLKAFQEHFTPHFARVQAIHVVGPAEFKFISEDEVETISGVVYHAGPKAGVEGPHVSGGGYYYETWKRAGDDWLMASLKFDNLYEKVIE